ncbi:CsgG/HfaB family protein [Myxococcota bacterium]
MPSFCNLALPSLAIILTAAPARAVTSRVHDPVAVLPFKNVNRAVELDWMSAGIAETLVSDIRKRSNLRVVEREQLDRALSEIALQLSKATDVTTAAAVGRIVGARTVVVGGFQKAGSQLRITARFVAVESGVVLDAAKATGPAEEIFGLQDEIVDRLLGAGPSKGKPSKPKPKRRKGSTRTLEAYEMYATSLTSVTVKARTEILRKTLEVDPDFSYALDDLEALEQRMKRYAELADEAISERAQDLRKRLRDKSSEPHTRQTAAFELYGTLVSSARHRGALTLGEEVYAMDWPSQLTPTMRPAGLFWIFQARVALKEPDLALQVGEQFLREFPATPYFAGVSGMMQVLILQKRQRDDGRARAEQALAHHAQRLRRLDFDRCEVFSEHHAFERAITTCRSFVENHAETTDAKLSDLVGRARWHVIEALVETGAFKEARRLSKELIEQDPETARRRAVAKRMRRWPRE